LNAAERRKKTIAAKRGVSTLEKRRFFDLGIEISQTENYLPHRVPIIRLHNDTKSDVNTSELETLKSNSEAEGQWSSTA